ncbi:Similar to S.cerevisiae protein YMR178W (Protein of unknown function) [Malassezia sympodialis ATCC 42132]|uniref:MoaB/Mog domain-containing protein n=1 Tax=Malassezia sympodialis (strain ATCC 42132) TaxID=1230383 RepID=A0A1M8A0L0_MALS4|nr:Similar to S.cerevisiae protein YMR178W (Protein of unknown function) [Malassezia sympodialis ATCC 42132]
MLHRLSAPTPLRLCARASSLVKPAPFVVKNFSITPLLENMSDTKSTDMLAKLFQRSHVPDMTGRPFIRTAACLIIGDEVLNGKTQDTNSNKMAKLCFEIGVELKKIEVISDDVDEIVEAAQRLSHKYDWVVTSGGIGPTPDDITYSSLAKAFGDEPLEYDDETLRRMSTGIQHIYGTITESENVLRARKRMALFPRGSEVLFPTEEYWVPVVRVNGNVCVLPGIPSIFEALLKGLPPYLRLDPDMPKPIRRLIHTNLPESMISPLLENLTKMGKKDGIRVGSYPKWKAGVHISLVGYDHMLIDKYTQMVVEEIGGQPVDV